MTETPGTAVPARSPVSAGGERRGPGRSAEVEPYLRGCAYRACPGVPYPRFDPRDVARIPADTWQCAAVPAGVRLELVGDARSVELTYTTATDDLGFRGVGAGTTFALWRGGELVDEQPAQGAVATAEAPARVTLALRPAASGAAPHDQRTPAVVYLPEGMRPEILSLRAVGGAVAPAPVGPRWIAYGDSLLEGWVASGPAFGWGAVAARRFGLDLVNMGYAGSARGEIPCAEAIAALDADVISVTHGTNCWNRTPHSAGMFYENTLAFLDIVRQGHPTTPVVVASPVLRPDAETVANRLAATLADLRHAMERAVQARIDSGDDHLVLVPGGEVLGPAELADGIHPNDAGHERLAALFGAALADAVASAPPDAGSAESTKGAGAGPRSGVRAGGKG